MVKNKTDNLTKKKIITQINELLGYPVSLSDTFLENFISIIIKSLLVNRTLKLKNIGTFKIKSKKKRIGRNPKTNEENAINERNVIKFKTSKSLHDKLNKYLQ